MSEEGITFNCARLPSMNEELATLIWFCFRLTRKIALETGLIERLLNYFSVILYLDTRERITASGEKSPKHRKSLRGRDFGRSY